VITGIAMKSDNICRAYQYLAAAFAVLVLAGLIAIYALPSVRYVVYDICGYSPPRGGNVK